MTFKLNGTEILYPTTHRWLPRDVLGINGLGHPVYPGVREYELRWQLASPADYTQLETYFMALSGTSTVVVDLPYFVSGSYTFYPYSGCVLREPEYGEWFNGYYRDVTLLITNIRT